MSGATAGMRHHRAHPRQPAQRESSCFDLAREVVAVGRAHGVDLPEDYAEQRMAFFDSLATGNDDLHASTICKREQAARAAMVIGRGGRSRRRCRRADAHEPRRARFADLSCLWSAKLRPGGFTPPGSLKSFIAFAAPDLATIAFADLRPVEPVGGVAEILERIVNRKHDALDADLGNVSISAGVLKWPDVVRWKLARK